MVEAALSLFRRFWRYALAALLLAGVALLAWWVITDALAWGVYRSGTEPVFSVRYPKLLTVRANYVDPSYAMPGVSNGVNFEYPPQHLQGSRVSQANLTVTPVPEGVECDAAAFVPFATTSKKFSEKGARYTYVVYGQKTDNDATQERVYAIEGTPCVLVRSHINFVASSGYDPDAPPSLRQGKVIEEGKIQYPDIAATFDVMRRSVNIKR